MSSVIRLNETNYILWEQSVTAQLFRDRVYEWVDGSKPRPDLSTPPTADERGKLTEWTEKDRLANSAILGSMGSTQARFVSIQNTAFENWTRLRQEHQSRRASHVENLRENLRAIRKTRGQNINKHISNFDECFSQFISVGGTLTELETCRIFLRSLDSTWDQFKTSVDTSEMFESQETGLLVPNRLTYRGLKSRAQEHQNLLPDTKDESAHWVSPKDTPVNESSKEWNPRINCLNCGGLGHVETACPSGKKPSNFQLLDAKRKLKNRSKPPRQGPTQDSSESAAFSKDEMALVTTTSGKDDVDRIFWDSGATVSVFNSKKWFEEYSDYSTPGRLTNISDSACPTLGEGIVSITLQANGQKKKIVIDRALFVPDARHNLISEGQLYKLGYHTEASPEGKIISKSGEKIGMAKILTNNLYLLRTQKEDRVNFVETKGSVESTQLHARLGHMSFGRMKTLVNHGMVEGLHTIEISETIKECGTCELVKARALPHRAPEPRNQYDILELIVADYKGPIETPSLSGATGYFIFKDAKSAYARIYPVKTKDGRTQMELFISFKNWVELQTGKRIRKFRHDRGSEFLTTEFQNYLVRQGIEDQTTAGFSPESNARAESHIRILDKPAKAMLAHAGLDKEFWADAFESANYIYNRSPTKALTNMTPIEALLGRRPRIDHFRVFGCLAYRYIPKELRRPLDYSGQVVRFVGYEEQSDAYRLWDGSRYISSRDVKFNENEFNIPEKPIDGIEHGQEWSTFLPPAQADTGPTQRWEAEPPDDSGDSDDTFYPAETPEESSGSIRPAVREIQQLSSALGSYWSTNTSRRSGRPTRPEEEANVVKEGYAHVLREPKSYTEALRSPEREQWDAAVQRELTSLEKFSTFSVVNMQDVPKGTTILRTTWRFTRKPGNPGHKARLCVRGDMEKDVLETEDVFASVVRTENLKLLLTLISTFNWSYLTLDVSTAFLNAPLKKDVYIYVPQGIRKDGDTCLKLNRALYGLREAPAAWNEELTNTLIAMGFEKTQADWNVFIQRNENATTIVAFHVDDGLLTSSNKQTLENLVQKLGDKYTIKVNRTPDTYLKVNFQSVEGVFQLHQENYIEACAYKFRTTENRHYKSPMNPGFDGAINELDTPVEEGTPYRSIVGCLLHIARQTRPDILFSVNLLSQYLVNPQQKHWNAAKRVMAYLFQTKDDALLIGNHRNSLTLECYTDATWACDTSCRRSRSGGVLFFNGSLLTAWSRQQPSVSLSCTEAEYQAMAVAVQEVMFFRELLQQLGFKQETHTPLFVDNKGALDLAVSTKNHPKVKHISIKFHFVRDEVKSETVKLHYISTEDQIADVFTKPLGNLKFGKFKSLLHIQTRGGVGIGVQ
jgi:hypothetical protein